MIVKFAAAAFAVAATLGLTETFGNEVATRAETCSTQYVTEANTAGESIMTVVTTCTRPHAVLTAAATPARATRLN
jgi:hypothetical protein